jgi:hypothetical protein
MSAESKHNSVKTLPPPRVFNVQFGHAWQIVTPRIYRYENQKWIDEFFDSGRPRLSTFAKFASYPDETRGDRDEGKDVSHGETRDSKSIILAHAQGMSAAVLCCSHRLDHALREGFNRDSAFQIKDTLGFAFEISRQLPGFRGGLEGSCIYRHNRSINRKIDFDSERYRRSDGTIDMQMIPDLSAALGGPELVLLKHKKYENQQEYRILWHLDSIGSEFIDVVAPKARQFCQKVDAADYHTEPIEKGSASLRSNAKSVRRARA